MHTFRKILSFHTRFLPFVLITLVLAFASTSVFASVSSQDLATDLATTVLLEATNKIKNAPASAIDTAVEFHLTLVQVNELLRSEDILQFQNSLFNSPTTPPGFKSLIIDNPLKITTGCGTVEANLDEVLTILLKAFTDALEMLPSYFLRNSLGFPDLSNPKEIFNFIFDSSTTLICQTKAGITQVAETSIWAPFAYIKNKLSTIDLKSTQAASATQADHSCGSSAEQDDTSEKKTTSTNLTADEQAEADIEANAIVQQQKNYQLCKDDFEEYKSYIDAQVKKIKILGDIKTEQAASTCDTINSEISKEKKYDYNVTLPNPFYLDLSIPEPKCTGGLNGQIAKACTIMNFDSDEPSTEVVLSQSNIAKITEIPLAISSYQKDAPNEVQSEVFKIGTNYVELITHCLNGTDAPLYNGYCSELDNSDFFPVKFNYQALSLVNRDILKALEKKKIFCTITEFNVNTPSFIINSIGYATNLISGSSEQYSIIDPDILRTATQTVVLNDFCTKKFDQDISRLKKHLNPYLSDIYTDNIYIEEQKISRPIFKWAAREVFMGMPLSYPVPVTTTSKKIHKICTKHKDQTDYFIAVPTLTGPVDIIKIPAANTTELSLALDDNNNILSVPTNFFKYETEMLCDGKAGETTCDISKLSCGINWEKTTARLDTLYENSETAAANPSASGSLGDFRVCEKNQKALNDTCTHKDFDKMLTDGLKSEITKLIIAQKALKSPTSQSAIDEMALEILRRIENVRN